MPASRKHRASFRAGTGAASARIGPSGRGVATDAKSPQGSPSVSKLKMESLTKRKPLGVTVTAAALVIASRANLSGGPVTAVGATGVRGASRRDSQAFGDIPVAWHVPCSGDALDLSDTDQTNP